MTTYIEKILVFQMGQYVWLENRTEKKPAKIGDIFTPSNSSGKEFAAWNIIDHPDGSQVVYLEEVNVLPKAD